MAKPRITQTVPYDSPGTLVSDAKDLCEIPAGSPPAGATDRGGIGSNGNCTLHLLDISPD